MSVDATGKKRVALTTISDVVRKSPFGGGGGSADEGFFPKGFASQAGSSGGGAGSGGSGSGKVIKQTTTNRQTIRLELELFEPNAKSFPEFNYSKLVHEAQKRKRKKEKKASLKTGGGTNGFLSDADNDDDVARIAKEMEKKYGAGSAYSSGPSMLDYCDRGAGYDEEDSFIDNTEAYDELIPQEVETVGGGFYINSGALEFKTLSNFERPDDYLRMPKPKKRRISSSSSEESSEDEEDEDEEEEEEEEEDVERERKKVVPSAIVKGVKRKEGGGGTSGTSGTESGQGPGRGRKRINGHVGKKQKVGEGKKLKLVGRKDEEKKKQKKEVKVSGVVAGGGKEVKVMKTTTVKDMLRAKRDSLLKMEQQKKGGRSSGTVTSSEAEEDGDGDGDEEDEDGSSEASDSDSSESGSSSDSSSESGTGEEQAASEKEGSVAKVNGEKKSEVKLPDNLPDHLVQDLNSLKDIAKSTSGKVNFLDGKVADLLLQIDVTSRMCSGSARNLVYKHLESHLQVSRQTLMIKIKKIRIGKEDNKVKKSLSKLETAIKEMMPKLEANYEAEKKRVAEAKAALTALAAIGTSEAGEKPEIKNPSRKFPWNDQLRGLLADIAQIRKQSFHILRPRKETEEDYVNDFLKKSVVTLWPSGWMRFEDLQKELDRRKKALQKAKESKKTVQPNNNTATTTNGPSKQPDQPVLSPAPPPKQPKLVRTPQVSPGSNLLQPPPPSTSPSTSKKTSDHSIINIISSPPSQKTNAHSTTPQPQPNFDEDLIKAHVINLETAHSSTKTSTAPVPDYLRSPTSTNPSSTSSSRRQSVYQDQPPPMAHAASTSSPQNRKTTTSRKSRDDDSDSSIEIVGEYSMPEKPTADPLNLAMPTLNKDKYKKLGSSAGSSTSSKSTTINNNNLDKQRFALPGLTHHQQELKPTTSVPTPPPPVPAAPLPSQSPRLSVSSSATGDPDVFRIMKELQELQAIQMAKQSSPQPAHSDSRKSTVISLVPSSGLTAATPPPPSHHNHHRKSEGGRPVTPQQQQQQQSHHKTPTTQTSVIRNGSGGSKTAVAVTFPGPLPKPKVLNPVAAAAAAAAAAYATTAAQKGGTNLGPSKADAKL